MHRRSLLAAASLLPFASCARPPEPAGPKPPSRPRERLDGLGRDYEALMTEHGYHEWARYAGEGKASPEADAARMAELRRREQEVVDAAAQASRSSPDAASPREAELWERASRGLSLLSDPAASQLSDQLEKIVNDWAFEVEGKRVSRSELRKLSRSDDAGQRRAAHRAWAALHREAVPVARQLLRRRRDIGESRRLSGGFFAELLRLRGVSPERLAQLFTALLDGTRARYASTLAEAGRAAGLARVAPWDIDLLVRKLGDLPDDRFPAGGALSFAHDAWGMLGVDLDRPKVRIDVRDFAFGGQTISLHVPDDVRAVVSPAPGFRFYSTFMHELGHAFAATRNRETEPVFKGYEWVPGMTEPGFDEGLAEVFGRMLDEPALLARLVPSLSEEERARFVAVRAKGELFASRQRMLTVGFERAALAKPDGELDALYRALEKETLGIEAPPGAEPTWAASPFLATYPVYVQSYVLAAMLSSQVRAWLRGRVGPMWATPEAGKLLAEGLVEDGARTTTDQKLARSTGSPLSAEAYVAWLNG